MFITSYQFLYIFDCTAPLLYSYKSDSITLTINDCYIDKSIQSNKCQLTKSLTTANFEIKSLDYDYLREKVISCEYRATIPHKYLLSVVFINIIDVN